MKWICGVCGYIHQGLDIPSACPVCKLGRDHFERLVEGNAWADEHVIGTAQQMDEEVRQGLREQFQGECAEIGLYLAMSRVADDEGYPEISATFRRVAMEEAEHAAQFAQLLGEGFTVSTKENLRSQILGEAKACQNKQELAELKGNYGAVRDAVSQMCRDEARHGKMFEGLLKRYFD